MWNISLITFYFDYMLICCSTAAKLLQLCPTLCDPIDGSPPGPAVPGILQARTLEWVAISSSNAWKWKVKVKLQEFLWYIVLNILLKLIYLLLNFEIITTRKFKITCASHIIFLSYSIILSAMLLQSFSAIVVTIFFDTCCIWHLICVISFNLTITIEIKVIVNSV